MKNRTALCFLLGIGFALSAGALENLAKGKPYTYSREPDYALSKDDGDKVQLTDGIDADPTGTGDYMWTRKGAVTWNLHDERLVISVDLGKTEWLGGFQIDVAAGAANVPFPESVTVYASEDGKNWRFVGDLYSTSCAENGAPKFNGTYERYYIRSTKLKSRGRHVAFVAEDKWLFCTSEIEIYRGTSDIRLQPAGITDPIAHAASARAVARILRDLDAVDPENETLRDEINALADANDLKNVLTIPPLNDVHRRVWARNAPRLRKAGWTKPAYWFDDRWANLNPLAIPEASRRAGTLDVRMMRNETRATAVNIVNPTDAPLACTVAVEGLPAGAGLDCREVVFTDTKMYATVAGALKPGAGASVTFDIPAGASKQAWISFNRPKCPAGTYRGNVVATLGDGTRLEHPIALDLVDLTFPDRPRCHVGGFDYQVGDCSFYGIPKATAANIRMMREIYADCPWATREVLPKIDAYDAEGALVNEASFDWTKWDEWVARFPEASYYFVFADSSFKDRDGRFAYKGEPIGTPRFNRMVSSYYAAWRRHVIARGIDPKKIATLLLDEPGEWKPRHREIAAAIVAYAKAIKKGAPEFKIFEDPDYNVDPRLDGEEQFLVCDALCPQVAVAAGTSANSAANRLYFRGLGQKGKELWLYSCSGPVREFDPISYYRQMYWLAYQWGAVGCHYWAFGSASGGDSWHAFRQHKTEYSPWFVSPTDVMAAKQSEGIREGVEDYEYLKMLEDAVAAAKKSGRDVTAAEKLLQTAPEHALNQTGANGRVNGVMADNRRWDRPKNRTSVEEARLQVLEAILKLRAPAVEKPYDFRRRLEVVHQPNRRDAAAKPEKDEIVLADGFEIALGPRASELVCRVAADFVDYLAVSMDVDARVTHRGRGGLAALSQILTATVDASLPARRYTVTVGDGGAVVVAGADERAVAQAFYHLEDLMNLRCAPFLKKGTEVRMPRFETRMVHSGYGHTMFEEPLLNAMAHAGMTAIIVYAQGVDKSEHDRVCDQRAIIRRAAKYGLDTYLYSEVPAFIHPDDGDAPFDAAYGPIAAAYPEAKGIILVGESCQFPSKDPRVQPLRWQDAKKSKDKRPLAGWFPCSDYADWLKAVQRAITKRAPGMKTVFWTYNWGWAPAEDRVALIDKLPQDTILEATFEMFEKRTLRNGIETPTADYSLSIIGPGRYFTSEAAAAKRRGLTFFTQANAGGRTWDFGTLPYEPFPFQWQRRWEALVKAHDDYGLAGIMESHHYGWTPSFIAELEKEAYTEGGMPFAELVKKIAARDFGAANAELAMAAWKRWSDAMNDYVPTNLNQYGPFRCGPAYPFSAGRGTVDGKDFPVEPQSLVGHGFIRLNYINLAFVPETWKEDASSAYMEKEIELLDGMIAAFESGAGAFAAMPGAAARRQMLLGRYLGRVCRTAKNVKRGWIAARAKDEAGILAAAREEYANAAATIPLVEEDSHLGFEPDMDYVGGPKQIRWKLGLMEKMYGRENLK